MQRHARRLTAGNVVAQRCTSHIKICGSLPLITKSNIRMRRNKDSMQNYDPGHASLPKHKYIFLCSHAVVQIRDSRLSPTQDLATRESQSEPHPANVNAPNTNNIGWQVPSTLEHPARHALVHVHMPLYSSWESCP